MDFRFSSLKHHFLHHLVFYLTLSLGLLITCITQQLTTNLNLSNFFDAPLPSDVYAIFFHNLKFIVVYSIPFVGHLYYVYSFLIIFITIGLSYNHLGFLETWIHLFHLPIEVFAFALVLQHNTKPKIILILISILLLALAAWIEFLI